MQACHPSTDGQWAVLARERERSVARRGTHNLLIILVLVLVTAYGGLAGTSLSSHHPAATTRATPEATPADITNELYEAVAPAHRQDVIAATEGRISQYTIRATLRPPGSETAGTPATPWASPVATPASSGTATPPALTEPAATITGVQELRFVNDTGTPLQDLYFRLYPNLRQYDEGRMEVWDITVDGIVVQPESPPLYSVPASTPVATPAAEDADLILIRVPLADPLAPGDATTVEMRFTTTVPVDPPDDTGLFRYMPETGSWTLAHWFPILAGFDPEHGWETDPPAAWSDLTFSNTALFDVTLTAPDDLVLVTTGVELEGEAHGGQQLRRFASGPARDFAIVADSDLIAVDAEVDGTTVTSYHHPQNAAGGEQILTWATQSLAVFTEMFGPYPYTTLDVVAVPHMIGYEFPQMIFIGSDYYPDPVASGTRPGAIEFLVAHEVAHQWWYGMVGSNIHRHAFLDEGLTEYSAVIYFEKQYGSDAAQGQLDQGLTLRYATMLLTAVDQVVDQPTSKFPDLVTYYTTVYRKAGLGFAALRSEVGDKAFFAALQDYAASHRFDVATPGDLLAAFEDASSRELDAFWHLWFETASGQVKIVMEPETATPASATPATPEVAMPGSSPVATPID